MQRLLPTVWDISVPPLTNHPSKRAVSPFGKSCVSSGRARGPEFSLEGRMENAGCLVGERGERKQTLWWVLTGPQFP